MRVNECQNSIMFIVLSRVGLGDSESDKNYFHLSRARISCQEPVFGKYLVKKKLVVDTSM